MREVLYANILTIIGQLITFYSSTRKQKNQILIFQIVAMAVMSCGSLLLKGYSAIVMDAVAILRNLFSIFSINFKGLPIFFIVLSLILGYLFNNMGFIGYLPMIANVGQSIFRIEQEHDDKTAAAGFCLHIALLGHLQCVDQELCRCRF